jgi:hypothetical protein
MSKYSFPISVAILALLLLSNRQLEAQSTVIKIGGPLSTTESVSVKSPGESAFPPSTAGPRQRKWEALLSQKYPTEFEDVTDVEELVSRLRQIGLPVILTDSARDDSLDESTGFKLVDLPKESLYVRLQNSLSEKNAVLTIVRNEALAIISLDDIDNSRFLSTISYDVTALNIDGDTLVEHVLNLLDSDGWEETGRGLGTISTIDINGSRVLTINNTYPVHRQTHEFLKGLFDLQHNLARSSNGNASGISSRIIEPPIDGGKRKKRGKFGGQGIGGFGQGGGVF